MQQGGYWEQVWGRAYLHQPWVGVGREGLKLRRMEWGMGVAHRSPYYTPSGSKQE